MIFIKHNKMMLLLLGVMLLPAVLGQVKISEVYYDPVGTESGGEVIELHNEGAVTETISGWIIATPTSLQDATIPEGTVLEPGAYYLIADEGFSTAKDNPLWPNANHEEAITLKNTDGGVALKNAEGTVIDAVGWGDQSLIEPTFFEGTPHAGAGTGESLQRTKDTQNNAQDFFSGTPQLHSTGGGSVGNTAANDSSSTLTFTVTVDQQQPDIVNISVSDEDPSSEGIQIYPEPKKNKDVMVRARIRGNLSSVSLVFGEDDVAMKNVQNISSSESMYQGTLSIPFYETPGVKNLEIIANGQGTTSKTQNFTYTSLNAFELDTLSLQCSLQPGQICNLPGDLNMNSTNQATLRNIGNTALDLQIKGTDLAAGSNSIGVQNIEYQFGSNPKQALSTDMQQQNIHFGIGPNSLLDFSLSLQLPSQTSNGAYVSQIMLASLPQ